MIYVWAEICGGVYIVHTSWDDSVRSFPDWKYAYAWMNAAAPLR